MRRDAVFGAALLILGLAMAIAGLGTMHRQPDRRAGDAFPPLALTALDGMATTFDARGKPAIVTVFTTWCVPCREEFAKIATASSSPWGQNVRFVEIDYNEPASRVSEFIAAYPRLHATVLLDRSHAVNELGIYSFPRTVAVAVNGKVTGRFDGPLGYTDLRALVAGATRRTKD